MAVMWPATLPPNLKSKAEGKIFGRLQSQLGTDWTVLHSLGLTGHARKPWAEIDFVVIGPLGLFCLEVKGGRIRRDAGQWIFTDGDGRDHLRNEGPFEQVGGAAAALHKHLASHGRRDVAVHYTVVTPDVRFRLQGPDIENELVYDEADAGHPFGRFLQRVHEHDLRRGIAGPELNKNRRKELRDLLRGDFDLRPSLRSRLGEVEAELVRLTAAQRLVMDTYVDNDRVMVTGGAGTGKTLLAVAEAERLADSGRRVLFTCHSRRLAAELGSRNMHPGIKYQHIHGLLRTLVAEAGLEQRLGSATGNDLYDRALPDLGLELLLDRETPPYDVLIIDEAQDILTASLIDVYDELIVGGLRDGLWRVFHDPQQNIFEGTDEKGLQRLRATRPTTCRLVANCRNTQPIAVHTGMLSQIDCPENLAAEGPAPEYIWYSDAADQRRRLVRYLNRLLSEGVRPADVVVLSPYRFERSVVSGDLGGLARKLLPLDHAEPDSFRFATVASFKGLESQVVVLVDFDAIEGARRSTELYVAMSRSRSLLAVFLPESERSAYDRLAAAMGARLVVDDSKPDRS